MSRKHIKVALVYDFDGTLAPGNMQELSFIPSIDMDKDTFWTKVKQDAKTHEADEILCYMHRMLEEARHKKISIHKNSISSHGKNIPLFDGVDSWFSRINEYGKNLEFNIRHYIISSGLKEMIEGTSISNSFDRIYASAFSYDTDGIPYWPALSVNYTNKTQYLFRINKGALDIHDAAGVNKFKPPEDREVPFSRMIYFGDGDTDIPCMRLVKAQGGHSFVVYTPSKKGAKKRAEKLLSDGRVNAMAPADYSENGEVEKLAKAVLDKIRADTALSRAFRK